MSSYSQIYSVTVKSALIRHEHKVFIEENVEFSRWEGMQDAASAYPQPEYYVLCTSYGTVFYD